MVGEGNMSFSNALFNILKSAKNLTVTSFNKNVKNSFIDNLIKNKTDLRFSFDATKFPKFKDIRI